MKGKRKDILIIAVAVAACIVVGALVLYSGVQANAVANEGSVHLYEGATYGDLQVQLGPDGKLIRKTERFDKLAKALGLDKSVRPGHYRLREGMSYIDVVNMFRRGNQTPVRLTFNNIRTLPQLAGRISQQIGADSLTLVQTFLNDTMPVHYGFNRATFLAMFIPETYEVYWTISPTAFLDRMNREYENFWTAEREEKLAKTGLSKAEAITLASIVYEETKMSDEMPTVAGVYINRLNRGMKLQADPTVKFAVGDFALQRVLYRHLEVDSPYNTYMYEGLPPGPICMPSVKAIDAVLDYQQHRYLFFCAKPDFSGYHNFAVTNAEHERNRQRWVEALNRAGIR